MAALNLIKKEASGAPTSDAGEIFPKWKLALALGVPLAAVLGLGWYWYRTEEPVRVERVMEKTSSKKHSNASAVPDSPKRGADVAEAITRRGTVLYKEGRYEEALAEFGKAVRLCPATAKKDLAILLRNRAACYDKLGNFEEVVRLCTKALDLDPKYLKAMILRSIAWEKLDNLEEALFDITTSCILDGFQSPSSLETADRILKEIGLRKAKLHMKSRKSVLPSDYFIRNYLNSFCEDPIDMESKRLPEGESNGYLPGTHYCLALEAMRKDDFETVLKECEEELAQTNDVPGGANADGGDKASGREIEPKALLLRGTMYFLMGDGPKALKDFTACIGHPDASLKMKVNALVKRACQYLQDEDVNRCLSDFTRALELDPNNADVLLHRGQVLMLLEMYDKAIADFQTAARLQPDFPPPHIQKCLAEYRRAFRTGDSSQVAECSEKFRRTVEQFPKCADGFLIYGQILLDLNQIDEAERYMDRAYRITPKNAMILVHKALLMLQARGNADEAVKWISQAIEVDEKCEYAYETLATFEVQRGNLEKAVELFNKAIHLGKTELELTHLISLRDAAATQIRIREKTGVSITGDLAMAAAAAFAGPQ